MANRYLLFVVLGFTLCTQLAFAQVNTATISGTLHDTSGAVLPGASVTIVNQETGISPPSGPESLQKTSYATATTLHHAPLH